MNPKIIEPGSQALIPAWKEKFAQLVAGGMTAKKAYLEARKKTTKPASDGTAETNGPALLRETQSQLRIAYIRNLAASGMTEKTLLTIQECLQFCTDVVRAPIADTEDKSPLWQKLKIKDGSIEKEMPAKLAAMELFLKMSGQAPAEKVEITTTDAAADMVRKMLKEGGDE